jgi:hypothetical protein
MQGSSPERQRRRTLPPSSANWYEENPSHVLACAEAASTPVTEGSAKMHGIAASLVSLVRTVAALL